MKAFNPLFVLFALPALLVTGAGCDRPDGPAWTARYAGPGGAGEDEPAAVGVDPWGNIIVTGASDKAWPLADYATVKYDPQGNQQWAARYDGPRGGDDRATSLAVGADGSVYVTGDPATIKYDPDGNERWVACHPERGARAVALDAAGNVYVAGYITAKYDPEGNELWSAPVWGEVLAVDAGGNAYLARQTVTYLSGSDAVIGRTYLSKIGEAGREQWSKLYEEEGDRFVVDAVALSLDPAGNLLAAWTGADGSLVASKHDPRGRQLWEERFPFAEGRFGRMAAVGADPAGDVLVTGTECAGFLAPERFVTIKYGRDGTRLWTTFHAGRDARWNAAGAQAVDALGNVYVAGAIGTPPVTEFATVKYDPRGNLLWEERHNGPGAFDGLDMDGATALTVDPRFNVYVTGISYGQETCFDFLTLRYVQWNR